MVPNHRLFTHQMHNNILEQVNTEPLLSQYLMVNQWFIFLVLTNRTKHLHDVKNSDV